VTWGYRGRRQLDKGKMRFHWESRFGVAWASHFVRNELEKLSISEQTVEFNRFSHEYMRVNNIPF